MKLVFMSDNDSMEDNDYNSREHSPELTAKLIITILRQKKAEIRKRGVRQLEPDLYTKMRIFSNMLIKQRRDISYAEDEFNRLYFSDEDLIERIKREDMHRDVIVDEKVKSAVKSFWESIWRIYGDLGLTEQEKEHLYNSTMAPIIFCVDLKSESDCSSAYNYPHFSFLIEKIKRIYG